MTQEEWRRRAVGYELGSRSRSFKAVLASVRMLGFILRSHKLPAESGQRRCVLSFPFKKDQTAIMNWRLKMVHESGTEF